MRFIKIVKDARFDSKTTSSEGIHIFLVSYGLMWFRIQE